MRNKKPAGMHYEKKVKLCLLPAFAGLCVFYFLPFLRVVAYSFLQSAFIKKFAGLKNYIAVLKNPYFQLACRNTLQMVVICVPCYLLLSFLLSLLFLSGGRRSGAMRKFSIFPMILPTVAVVASFQGLFSSFDSALPIYLIFLWKYCGYGVILLSAAMKAIPAEYYEAAKIDGAGNAQMHLRITLPLCHSAMSFVGVLGTVFCFRIFRESSLYYYGDYPPDYSYTLQYYMNNHFVKLNYQNLAVASLFSTIVILALVLLVKKLGRVE